jgi:hypothetical protein
MPAKTAYFRLGATGTVCAWLFMNACHLTLEVSMKARLFALVLFALLPLTTVAQVAEESVEALVTRLGGKVIKTALPGKPIISIDLHGSAVTDADLARIATVTTLKALDLRLTAVTDAGIAQLGVLTELQHLNLFRTSMTDAGLASLGNLQKLETLLIGGTAISDAGTAVLVRMPALRKVSLFDTRIGDAALLPLGAMAQLDVLLLGRTAVSETAMRDLQVALPALVFSEAT